MMNNISPNYYSDHVKSKSILLIFSVVTLFGPYMWVLGLIWALYVIFLEMGCMYPVSMHLTDTVLVVEYREYFKRHILEVKIADTILTLNAKYEINRRSVFTDTPPFYILNVVTNGKTEAYADSRNGFTYEIMMDFMQEFADAKAKL